MTPNAECGLRNVRVPPCVVGLVWLIVLGCLLSWPAVAWACPGCKDALFEPDQLTLRLSSAKGYALSIGLLLGVPAALAGTVATLLVRSHRQRRGTQRRGPLDPSGQSR